MIGNKDSVCAGASWMLSGKSSIGFTPLRFHPFFAEVSPVKAHNEPRRRVVYYYCRRLITIALIYTPVVHLYYVI